MKKIISMLFAVAMVFGFISNANAAKTLKCQTVLNTKADEVKMKPCQRMKSKTSANIEYF